MAQVTTTPTDHISFDWLCEYVAGQWGQLSELVAEWHEWDIESRMDFLTDWPVTESYTEVLFAREGTLHLSAHDAAKVREVRALVERNRPILEQLEACIREK
ncbi:MAG: hypothetical protein ACR2JW_06960 [Thermomicrobiales bacterium]